MAIAELQLKAEQSKPGFSFILYYLVYTGPSADSETYLERRGEKGEKMLEKKGEGGGKEKREGRKRGEDDLGRRRREKERSL